MSEWESRRLLGVAEVILGRQRSPQHDIGPHMVPYLRAANVQPGRIDFTDVKSMNFTPREQKNFAVLDGDVLVTEGSGSLASVGASARWEGPTDGVLCFQNTLLRLRARSGTDPRWLAWWSQHAFVSGLFAAVAGGANIYHLSADRVRGLTVALPPLDEQRRIADFLDTETARLDRLATAQRRTLSLLSELAAEVIRQGVSGALLDPTGTSAPPMPWIGNLHREAAVVPLVRALVLQRGVDLTDAQREPGDVPVVTTAGVSGTHNRAIARGPGVVIGRYGTVGAVHWVDGSYWPHNTTLYVKDFRENYARYCYYLLRAFPFEMQQARAAVPGVNRNDLHREIVAVLPRNLQCAAVAAIEDRLSIIESTLSLRHRLLGTLAERRQALVTAAVTGQIDVTTASGGTR